MAKINERFESLTVRSEKEYQVGQAIFRPNLSSLTVGDETHSLPVRQCEILQLLAENEGSLVERDLILEKVWGDASYANSLALNVQITYLRRAIASSGAVITSLKKRGYILSCH